MLTTSAAGLNPVLSSSISLQQEQSGKAKRLGASRRNVKLSKHCQLIHGLRARKCTRASAHKVEKRYHSATDRISNTLTVVNNGNLSSNNKALKKCSAAIKKIDAALFDRKTKLMEGHRHKPCRTRKGRAYNKSDKSQKCTLVALSRQLKRCNGVVPENTRTRSVRSANSSTAEKNNELATVHQLQQQSAQAQRKITRQLPDASTDTSNVSGKKTTSPFCKDLKNFQIPQRFQIENAQPSTSPVTDKLRSLQSYLKAIDLATDSRKGFLASLTQANADSAGILSDLIKVGQALEQRIAVHSRMLSSRSYSRPCKTSNGQRETLADSQSHMIALINAYELGCSQLGISPEVASVTNEDLPSSEGEEIVALLPNLKSVDRSLNQVSMMQRNIDRTTQIVNEAHLHANLTTSATPSHNVMMIVAERQAIDDLLNSVVNQRWAVQVDNYIKNNRDIITNVSENEINDLLNTLPIIKAYLKLSTLRVLIGNYKKGLASINEDNASAGYQQLLEYINNSVSSLAPLETSGGRKKRSIEDDQQQLESTIEASMDKLLQQPYSNGFSDYCRGYQDYLTHFLNKLRGNNDDSEHQWDVDDQALSEAIEAKKFNIQTQNNLLSNTKECFSRNDYYQAGQKSCVSSMMLMVSYMASNPIKALQKFQKESMESEFQLTSMLDDSFSVVTEINSIDASNLYNLVIMGNPFYFSELKKDADGNCFATALLQAIAGNLNYYKNVFSAIEIGSFQTQPILSTANILQLISRLGIMEHNMMLESTDTEGRILLSNSISRVQNLLVKEGFDIQSYFLKKLQEDIYEIHSDISDLPSVNINTSDMSTSGFGRHMLKEYKIAKRIALESGRSISQLTFMIHLDYGDAGHETIGSVTENADGSVTLCFEDSNSGITSLTGDSLEFLLTHAHLFDVHVGDRLDKLETGDLENPHPQEFNIIQLTPEIISRISRLQILPSNPLSLADIARAPFDTVPVLEQKRRLENYRQLFSKLKDNRIYNAFTNIAKKKQVPNPEKVSSSDPLDYQVREILTAINECETTGALPDKSVIMLVKNVINEFSRVFNVIEKLADQQFINGFDAQFLESVTELSVSMMDLPENKIGSSRFSSLIKTFKKQVKKFKSRLDTNHEKLSVSDSASTGSKKALSADEQLQMQKNLLGVLAEKKSLPSWLSGFKKQSSATSSDQTQLQAEQALMNELRNFGSLFFSLTGHLPAGVSSSEGITLTDEAKIIARYGIKKVLDMSSESLLLSPEVNPIFAGIMNDPVIKPLLVRMNDYFATKPSSSTSSTTEIVLGSLGGAGLLGAAVTGIYKSVSSRISSAGDSGAGRGVLVDEEVTDEEVNAVLEELGIDPVNPEPVSQPEANPQSEDIEMPDFPDVPNHPLIPNTEAEEVEDSEAGGQKVKIRCKKSIDGGCSRRPEDEEGTNTETENAADEADFVDPEVIFEDLPGIETVAASAGFRAARSELKILKNLRWTGTSRVFPATSPIARLLPSTRINWINPGYSSASLIRALQFFPKVAVRLLGACSNAALPITYGVTIGLQFAQDIGKWMEQETYEQGLTTVDDIMSYLSLFFPAAMAWQKIAPELALERLHEIKDRFVPWMAVPASPLPGLQAFEALHDIASDPTLGVGHARFDFPDGTVLYRASYKKIDMPVSTDSEQEAFDQLLQGETTKGRVDFYVITKNAEGQSQEVLASGTYFGITSSVLDTLNTKHKKMALAFRAINTINQKYIFETLDRQEELRKINNKRYPWQGLSPQQKFRKRMQERAKLNREFPGLKAAKEAESRAKVEPIYSALEQPITSFVFEAKRQEAATHEFFKTTALYAAHNGTLNWQEARNQFSGFMLKEGDEGYRDEVTSIYEFLDPEYRKRVKPAYIGLERENLPVEGTEKAQAQQQNLRVYTTNTGKVLVDILHLYPDVEFKSSESSPAVNLYEATDEEASSAPSIHAFESSVVTVPDILGTCRHARHDAADKNIESFHSTYDDVVPTLTFEQIQTTRTAENQDFLDSQTFTYYEVSGSNEHVLILRQISVGALLSSLNGDIDHPHTPRAWRHYSSEMRKHVYRLALQQITGESRLIPIMDSGNRTPMTPTERPVIGPDGQIVKQGAFLSSSEHQFQAIDTCDDAPCIVGIDAMLPWHNSETTISLQKVVNHETGETETYSSNSPELQIIPNRRKIIFSDAYLKQMSRYSSSAHTYYMLYFYPVDEDGEVISAGYRYLARLNHDFFQRKQVLHLREPVDPSKGVFKILKRLFTADGHDRGGVITTIPAEHISQPPGSVRVHGQLPPGRYVIQANRGHAKQTFVITPISSAVTENVQECLTSNHLVSLETVKERLDSSISVASRYGEYWKVILGQLLDVTGSEDDEGSIGPDDLTQGDAENYQILVTQYQLNHGQYQPCREVGLAEESQHGLDKLVRLIMLCEQSSKLLKKEDLIHLLKNSLALPRSVFEAFVTSQLSIQAIVDEGGVANTTLTPERQTMPGRRLLSVGDEFDRNSAMRLGSPFNHMAYLCAKAAEIPRKMILGGTVLIKMGGQLWNQYADSTQHQAGQPNRSDISKVTIETSVLGSCNKDMAACKPGQVAVSFRSNDEKACQLISGNQKAPCEGISRPARHELTQEKPNRRGLKRKIALNSVHELGGRALDRWNKDTAVMGQGDLHPLTMPGTKAQSWNQVLALYEKNHGKLPDGFGVNLGKDGKYYSTYDANSMVCNHSSKQCTISSPLENTSWSEHLAGKLSNWFYQNNQGQQDSQSWASAKTRKTINSVVNASLFDEKARIANSFNTLGNAIYGQMELANIFLHWKNNRTMVPSYKADAGRMIDSSSDESIINESHQVNIDFLQSAYELIPDLLQDVVDFLKSHTDDTTVSKFWTDADKLNIILLTHYDLSSHFKYLLDTLPQPFIESYLQDVYHSQIGPEHERYANVFDLTDDSGVCLKGSDVHAAGAIHKQHFFTAIEGEMQPENELGIHFIRSMLNVLAVNALKFISKQHDGHMISRCLLIKQKKSSWQSIKDLRPFKPDPLTSERVRKHCYQELLSELRQHGRYSSNNENSYSENVKKARLTSTATIKNDKALKENHYIRFIIDMNSSLENCQISTLDKRMFALFVWESMQEFPTESVSGRVASNHEMKRQMSICQQVYQRVIDTQPDDMKYPELDQDLEQEIASDVAVLSFFGLQNRQGKADDIAEEVDLQWKRQLTEYYQQMTS
ncbi:hypothetical protein [Endozoicomonas ascidiicola]|uniref:hypothetical protein n=1 Tax=Endozoicomonas ascidiicola TaxID=1698521 RepID=UPI00082C3762|nr:hypothetical protein [Endozoicomonas ascidiicola]